MTTVDALGRGRRPRGQRTVASGALLLGLVAGCSQSASQPGRTTIVRAPAAVAAYTATPANTRLAIDGPTVLGLEVFRALGVQEQGNLAISPAGLATVLGMLAPGARGTTAAQFAAVLGAGPASNATGFAAALGALDRQTAREAAGDSITLRQSDALWTQQGARPLTPYLDTLAGAFRAGLYETDFTRPEAARQAVNLRVAQETGGHITGLFPPGSLDDTTRLVLTDAIYLKARWANTFEAGDTAPQPFTPLSGAPARVPTMNDDDEFGYASGPGWQAAELPYRGGHLAMDVLLPAAGGFAAFRTGLTGPRLAGILGALRSTPVDLSLPRFTTDTPEVMNQVLARLGLSTAFEPGQADFRGITTSEPLAVGTLRQDTYVAVGEQGTTAAAGTGAGLSGAAAPGRPSAIFDADRPFVFLIRDTSTGRLLFLGQIVNPAGA